MRPADERKYEAEARLFNVMINNVATMLNRLRLTPNDFIDDEEFFSGVWDSQEHLAFNYGEMLGNVWFENGKWNGEAQEHA